MADGYDLEIDVDLDDDPYQRKIRGLVAATRKYAAELENSLKLSPKLDTKAYQAQITRLQGQKLKDKTVNLDADTAKAQADIRAFQAREEANAINKRVDVNTSYANAQLLTFSRGIEQTANRLGSLALLAGGAGAAIGALGAGIAGFGLATAARLDQAQFGFERLMGGAQAAGPILADLKAAALNTPFDLNDVLTLAFRLKSAGRASNNLAKDATVLADALAATGGGAQQLEGALFQIQQLQGRSKILEREDLRTLNNQIPGFMAAFQKLFGDKREFNEPQKAMEAVFAALKAIPGAAGAAAAATEQTFSGRFSKFKDVIQISFAEAFLPKKETLFKGLDTISEAIQEFLKGFAPAGAAALSSLGDALAKLIVAGGPVVILFTEALPKVLANFVPLVEKGADAFERLGITSDQVAKGITALLVGGAFLKLGGMILGVVTPVLTFVSSAGPLITAIGGIGTAFANLGAFVSLVSGAFSSGGLAAGISAFVSLANPITFIVAGVAALVAALGSAYSSSKQLRDELGSAFKLVGVGVKSVVDGIKTVVSGIFPFIKSIGEGLAPLFNALVFAGGIILTVLGGVLKAFGGILKVVSPIVGFLGKLALVFSPLGILVNVVRYAWERWGDTIQEVFRDVGAFFKAVGGYISGLVKTISGAIEATEDFLSGIPIIGDAFSESGEVASSALDKVKQKSKETMEAQKKQSEEFLNNMRQNTQALSSLVKTNLPAIDTSSLDAIKTSGAAQVEEMRKRVASLRTIQQAGYSDLILYASEQGGETGVALMNSFAQAIANNDKEFLDNFRNQLIEAQKLIAETELLVRLTTDASTGEFIKNIFGTGSTPALSRELGNAYNVLVANNAGASRKERKKVVDKFIETYAPSLDDNEKAALKKQLGKDFADLRKVEKEQTKKLANERKKEKEKMDKFLNSDRVREAERQTGERAPIIPQSDSKPGGGGATLGVAALGVSAVQSGASLIASFQQGISGGLANAGDLLSTVKTNISNGFSTMLNTVSSFAGQFFSAALRVGSSIANGVTSGLSSALGSVGDLGVRLWSSVKGFLNRGLDTIRNFKLDSRIPLVGGLAPFSAIPRLASGTQNFRGGQAIVGERGPELVSLPRGTQVTPAHKTKEAMKPTRTSSDVYNINVQGVSFEDAMSRMEAKMRAKRRQVMA